MARISLPIVPATVEYREIPGFPGYRVGADGSVWSQWKVAGRPRRLTGHWRRIGIYRMGKRRQYRGAHLTVNGVSKCYPVHALVLLAFVGPRPPGMETCHNDDNPANNCLQNLRWDTSSANHQDAIRNGRRFGAATPLRGSKHPGAILTESDIPAIRFLHRLGWSEKAIGQLFGVRQPAISSAIVGRTWKHV